MDAETVRWIITALMGVAMFFVRQNIANTQSTLTAIEVDIQSIKDTRLHKDDFREFKTELRGQFEELKQSIRDLKPHVGN